MKFYLFLKVANDKNYHENVVIFFILTIVMKYFKIKLKLIMSILMKI